MPRHRLNCRSHEPAIGIGFVLNVKRMPIGLNHGSVGSVLRAYNQPRPNESRAKVNPSNGAPGTEHDVLVDPPDDARQLIGHARVDRHRLHVHIPLRGIAGARRGMRQRALVTCF